MDSVKVHALVFLEMQRCDSSLAWKKKRSKWLWQLDFAKTISLTLDHVSSLAKEGEMSETDDNSSNWAEASHWLKHCSHNVIQCYTLCHTELYIMLYSVTVLSTRLMIKCAPHWSLTHFDSFHLHNWDSNWYLAKRSRPIPLIIFWCVCVADILKYMRYDNNGRLESESCFPFSS